MGASVAEKKHAVSRDSKGRLLPGASLNPNGKPKGLKSEITLKVREMVLTALDKAGGVDYLRRQADEHPAAFMGLLAKVLPKEVHGQIDTNVRFLVVTNVPKSGVIDANDGNVIDVTELKRVGGGDDEPE